MGERVRFPKTVWSDPEWIGLTVSAQLLAIACFMLGKNGAITDRRLARKMRWAPEFIASARAEIEASSYAGWLLGVTKRRKLPAVLVTAVKERDGYRCVACGSTDELQIDHIHPVKHGGSDDMDNLQTLCGPHNREKGAQLDWVMT